MENKDYPNGSCVNAKKQKLSAIVLTLNEEIHLERCLSSVIDVVDHIIIVDCYSSDKTLEIGQSFGASIFQKNWINYATQFNWALTKVPKSTEWVLRIDADEYLNSELTNEIKNKLSDIGPHIDGIYCGRRMAFQGKIIRHGGVFPIKVIRLFRSGKGQCENRWMDEHIKLNGETTKFKGEIIDDNLNSLTWWTSKHNSYASREAVDLLNLQFNFLPKDSIANLSDLSQAGVKRWIKEKVYFRLPSGLRAFAYFLYRYIIHFGFLDGAEGTSFHFLQGFWYRYLVDAKVKEVKNYYEKHNVSIEEAIEVVLEINLASRS